MPEGSFPEKRASPRCEVTWKVRYNESQQGEIHAINAAGVGLRGEKVYPTGTELTLRFSPGSSPEQSLITVNAVVRHNHAHVMGLRFVNVSPQDQMRIMQTISTLLAGASEAKS